MAMTFIKRPSNHLAAAMRLYPSTGRMVDMFRQDRGKDIPDWPAWCFMPMAAWYAVVSQDNINDLLPGQRLPPHLIPDVGRLAALGTWRYSQGIYRLDSDVQAALGDTIIVGDIPSEVLFRLPEWCVYVETPGRTWMGDTLHGYFAHLEHDVNTGRAELRLVLDTEQQLMLVPVHIGPWTVTEAIDRMASEVKKQASLNKVAVSIGMDSVTAIAAEVNPLISLLLYLCSEEPDIDDERQPGESPRRAAPKKVKSGWRLFPAQKPRIWTVGAKIGEQLRKVNQSVSTESGRTVKAHLRKGHWHGFWTGPKSEKQKFIYKWIMPMVVGGTN